MLRQTASIVRRGVRQYSFGTTKQDFHKVRENYHIKNKWVFLRRSGTDDLIFLAAAVMGVTIFGKVIAAYYAMLTGDKAPKEEAH